MTTGIALAIHPVPCESSESGLSSTDFEAFVYQYAERLLRVARGVLRSEDDAADAVQDGLASAFAARHKFSFQSTVYTWLYRIVVNACLMKIRTRSRRKTLSLDAIRSQSDDLAQGRSYELATYGGAAHDLERDETLALVRACIDSLPDDYRTILVMRDIEELDTDQTAARLNMSKSAVKTRLHRARRALRGLLEHVQR
jgi:RNA polymerase sigma-70 factor (ECF subfamily)